MTNLVKQFLVGDFVHLFTDRAVKDDGHLVAISFIHMAVQSIVTGVQLSTHKPWNVNEREILKDRDIQAEKINHKGRTDVTETDFALLGFGSSDESASESRWIKYHITDFTTPT